MPTRRQARVSARLIQEVSLAIRSLKNPRIGFVTVITAEVSPDLRDARVGVTILDDEETWPDTIQALQHSAGYVQMLVGRKLELKVTPRLHFSLDHSVATIDEMSRLIRKARASDPNPATETGEDRETSAD